MDLLYFEINIETEYGVQFLVAIPHNEYWKKTKYPSGQKFEFRKFRKFYAIPSIKTNKLPSSELALFSFPPAARHRPPARHPSGIVVI
jgi:hypothetical protein